MPFVLDINEIVKERKKLPIEAFFVDTNIIIYFKNPFGIVNPALNQKIEESVLFLKQFHKAYSALCVAQEYYKYIQNKTIEFFKINTGKVNLSHQDLKILRKTDGSFGREWKLRIKDFKKTFRKNFEIYQAQFDPVESINTFDEQNLDLGDWLLYKSVMSCDENMKCIFTNDYDFYALDGNFCLLTSNQKIINQAKADNKLQ